ncbi:hypothetical protein L9F63_024340, partial [Diploptera punctata]
WDDKITTLPGLYMLSVGVIVPLSSWLKTNLCTIYWLRFLNVAAACLNFYLLYKIQSKLHFCGKSFNIMLRQLLSALNMAIFPVMYFYTFFYYTDTLALNLVLMMYLLELHGLSTIASLFGLLAVVVRQTNIVWRVCMKQLSSQVLAMPYSLLSVISKNGGIPKCCLLQTYPDSKLGKNWIHRWHAYKIRNPEIFRNSLGVFSFNCQADLDLHTTKDLIELLTSHYHYVLKMQNFLGPIPFDISAMNFGLVSEAIACNRVPVRITQFYEGRC